MTEHEERAPAEDEPAVNVDASKSVDAGKVEKDGVVESVVSSPTGTTKSSEAIGLKLVAQAHTALNKCDKGISHLKKTLRWKIHLLGEENLQDLRDVHTGNFEDDVLDGWVEELLRFLALKTLQDDTTKPYQLLPSGPVIVAWKALMATPSSYAAVCLALGNDHPIDEDFVGPDVAFESDQERHLTKRLNATMRAYSKYFDEQPPALFWKGVKEPQEPNALVQMYQTAKQLWTDVASCGNDALETVSGCTSPKAAKNASAEENDILMEGENDDKVDISSAHANPSISVE